MIFRQRGQYSLETMVIIAVIAVALAAMQGYVQKCKQGNLREAAESVGDPWTANGASTVTIDTTVSGEAVWQADADNDGIKESHFKRNVQTSIWTEHSEGESLGVAWPEVEDPQLPGS